MLKAISQAEIDRIAADGRRLLRATRAEVQMVNMDHALSLGQPIPLQWGEDHYRVKPLSYRDGLALQRAEMDNNRWMKSPPQTVEDVEDMEAELISTLALFHSFLNPQPERNPFLDATPLEVGQLISFFSVCLMMQNVRPGAVNRSRSLIH